MNNPTEESDDAMLSRIIKYMEESKCYLDAEVSLASVSKGLGTNRSYTFSAINRLGKKFNLFVNEDRVKEAINLISKDDDKSINEIAVLSGFNNRRSFYNAFKAITGLSPNDFKNNLARKSN